MLNEYCFFSTWVVMERRLKYRGWSKRLCTPDDYSTKYTQKYFKQFQSLTMITYLELGITDGVSVSLVSPWPWRSAAKQSDWTLLVTFCIVIIRCAEHFLSPCTLRGDFLIAWHFEVDMSLTSEHDRMEHNPFNMFICRSTRVRFSVVRMHELCANEYLNYA
jgi:hypothetical protein